MNPVKQDATTPFVFLAMTPYVAHPVLNYLSGLGIRNGRYLAQ